MIVTEPQVGDVGLVSIPGFVGWLIKKMQRLNGSPKKLCRYEHCFMATDVSDLANVLAFEANPGGADYFNVSSRYTADQVVWVRVVELGPSQKEWLVTNTRELKDVPYSFLDYLALLAHRIKLPVPGLRDYISSTKHVICSQVISKLYQSIGFNLFNDEWPGYCTPADYYEKYGTSDVNP